MDGYEKTKKVKNPKCHDIDSKICNSLDPRKLTKMIVDFNDRELASIKSFGVKKKQQIKVTSRFLSGKLLMFHH